ncbi:MAG: AraC family transcriptional regulator, partial [Pseudomonadota bacterium]
LHKSQDICGDGIKFYRRGTGEAGLGQVLTPASDRGFLVGISLRPGHSRRIFHEHHSSSHDFDVNSVYVRSFSDDYLADLKGPFDFLLLEISRDAFDRALDERVGRRIRGLECVTGLHDPVLSGLGAALLPVLAQPRQASAVFVEQMGAVIETHLIEQYGGGLAAAPRRARALSRENERRAKDMLLSRLDGSSSIADIATACSLSRSHFIRAFRETTGQPPHQWLQGQRMERARQLLSETSTPLAEIAFLCGFADQSHFTRAFVRATGATPGKWQRSIRT